jgi:hypothetical protein
MMSATEIRAWLDTLPDNADVGIDDGGSALQAHEQDAYLEIGGMPPGTPKPRPARPRRQRKRK